MEVQADDDAYDADDQPGRVVVDESGADGPPDDGRDLKKEHALSRHDLGLLQLVVFGGQRSDGALELVDAPDDPVDLLGREDDAAFEVEGLRRRLLQLDGGVIADPLGLYDCDMPVDGAMAFVISSADFRLACDLSDVVLQSSRVS